MSQERIGHPVYDSSTMKVHSAHFRNDGTFEVIRSYNKARNGGFLCVREIYSGKDERVIVDHKEIGTYYPEHTEIVPARFEWDE